MRFDWALWRTWVWADFAWRACWGGHGVHSPFVYALATKVIPSRDLSRFDAIEALRRELERDFSSLDIVDFGAGPAGRGGARGGLGAAEAAGSATAEPARRQRTVSALALTGARRRAAGALLARLVAHLQPRRPLELGTQLGLSALYQASVLTPGVRLTSVEGSPAVAARAQQHLRRFAAPVDVITAPFSDFLDTSRGPWDWVLLDGHHQGAATLAYVEQLLPQLAPTATVVIDDIRWSPDMLRAWRQLQRHPAFTVSVDMGTMGLLFRGRQQAPEGFELWPGFSIFV